MRINQYLAKQLGISRRKADQWIQQGLVKINSAPAILGTIIQNTDQVEVYTPKGWQNVSPQSETAKIVLMYKPPKTMTTRFDPQGRRTIYDLLPKNFKNYKPVGRLDFMSEGLLILSQNGHLIFSLTHPKFKTQKVYLVGLIKPLTQEQIALAQSGTMELDSYLLNPVKIVLADVKQYQFLGLSRQHYWYAFTLSEGRNRQIRKMVHFFHNSVVRLIRVSHGQFQLTPKIYRQGYVLTTLIPNESSLKN